MTGLFVQLSTTPPGPYLQDLINHIRTRHPEIREAAFTDCQPWDLNRLDNIDLSGLTVYVGAPPVPWWGPRPDTPLGLQPWMVPVAGAAGMLTPSYRWDQILVDEALAQQSISRGWKIYVGSEIGIDALGDHPQLRQGWEAYLIELCRRLKGIRILWSPYAWDAWSTVTNVRRGRIQTAMRVLVDNVRNFSQTPGLGRIDLQDGRGAQPLEPETDAFNWYRLIKNCGSEVRINMELFASDLTPLPLEQIRTRRTFYAANSVPLGCSWEARYWLAPLYANHDH